MKTIPMHVSSRTCLRPLSRQALLLAAAVSMAGSAVTALAQTAVDKANSYTSLSTGSDWVGGVVPGANNIAVWNSGSGTPALEPLGGNLTWAGIQILGPAGPVTITPDGNTLTNGEVGIVGLNGIDMSSASQNLSFSNNIVASGVQNWNIGPGETLALGGTLSANSGAALRIYLGAGANVTITNAPNTLLGPTNGGAAGGNIFATVNDVDFAGVNSSQQIVPATGLGIYTANASGNPPSISGTINGVIDCTNAGTAAAGYGGVRLSNTLTIWGLLFNETNAVFGNWQVNNPSSRNLTLGSILVTTNCGNNPIIFVNGGGAPLITIAGTTGNLLIYQNNPVAPLTFQAGLTIRQGTATGTSAGLTKMGAGVADIQCNGTYAAGTRVYEGTLQIDGLGSVGAGALNVYGGAFAQSGPSTNLAPTTIFAGATNRVLAVAANSQSFDTSTLTFNAGSTLQFVYSNTIVPSTTTPALTLTNINGLTLNSPVNAQVLCGGLSPGTFPLVSYAGTIGGGGYSAISSLTLPPHIFGYLSNDVTHSLIDLVVTNVDQPIAWNTGSGVWDIGVTANWLDPLGATTTYQQVGPLGDNVVLNDNAPGPSPITVTLNTTVTPSSVIVNNANNTYTISGSGNIGGSDTFTKSGSGTLTLATANSFTGGININGGTVIFSTLPNLGAGAIGFGGGTLEYNGNSDDISARTVVLSAGGGTINTAGSTVNYANPIGNNSVGGLTKTGVGTLTLNGTNSFGGITTVNQGTLALGASTYLTNSAAIVVNSGAVLDTASSGVNLLLSAHSSQILEGNGQINGIVTASTLTTVSPGTSGTTATLNINGGFTMNGGTNFVDVAATSNDLVAVTGNLALTSGTAQINLIGTVPNGRYVIITYTGALSGSAANITPLYATGNQIASLDASVPGQIAVLLSTAAHDFLTWPGTGNSWDTVSTLDWLNGATAWAYTNGDTVTFNDSETGGNTTIQLMTNVQPTLVTVSNTVVSTYTFADGTGVGGGAIDGNGTLVKDGTGALIMQTANSYRGTTTIRNGTLQIGNGGIGNIGSGNVTNNGALLFEEGDGALHGVAGAVSGTGSLTVNGNTTIALEANNTYTGPTTISAGTLQIGNNGTTGNLGSTSAVTNNSVLAIDVSGPLSLSYNVTGSGSLAVQGQGTVSLAGNTLTYQGSTEISNGVVKLGANNEIPNTNNVAGSTGGLSIDGGTTTPGKLDLNGFNATVNALSGLQNNVNGIITNGSTSTTTTNVLTTLETVASTYNGQIMDHGTTGAKTELFVTGPGILTLNPTNGDLFSGGIVVSNGSLELGTPGANGVVNANESQLAPGTGPITLLGTNAVLAVSGDTGSTSPTYAALTNTLIVPAAQTATIYGTQRGNINSKLLGSGVVNLVTIYVRGGVDGDWSAFTGQINLSAAASGNGNLGWGLTNGLPNAMIVMTTNVDMYFGALNAGSPLGATFPIGALSGGDSSCQLEGQGVPGGNSGAQNVTYEIGGLNLSTTYSGGIVDTNNLLKVGTGTFTLNCGGVLVTNTMTDTNTGFPITFIGYEGNNVTYLGITTVSNGTLALDAPVNLPNSTNVIVAAPNAVLDASDMGYISNLNVTLESGATQEVVIDSTFEVFTNNTLGGIGTLNGIVQADQGSTLSVGLPTGTFNITSNAFISGTIGMNLDDTNAAACSKLTAPGFTINSTATLIVTNGGPGLTNNVTFTLFSKPVSGFASVTLPATDPTGTTNYLWQNNLALNGSITLTNGGLVIGPSVPPILHFGVSGTTLTLSWLPPYLGDVLQVQTNSLHVGINTNWVNVTGSASVTNMSFNINPANGTVFYRLAP